MSTTLLVGSGVSYYSLMPGVNSITHTLLNCEKITRGGDSNYYIEGYTGFSPITQPHLQGYLTISRNCITILTRYAEEFYQTVKKEHTINYEDIYYMLKQIEDSYNLDMKTQVFLI